LRDVDDPTLSRQLTDGGEVISFTDRLRSNLQKNISGFETHFYKRLSKPQGPMRPEGLGKLKKLKASSGLEPAAVRLVAYCCKR
jgi:hypothetical protein